MLLRRSLALPLLAALLSSVAPAAMATPPGTTAVAPASASAPAATPAPTARAVLVGYADQALAKFQDAHAAALDLKAAVAALIAAPSDETLKAARAAWLAARIPYMQTEVYRFGNPVVDAWEGKVNAWPLDEGLIDYVAPAYGKASDENPFYAANVIASPKLSAGGKKIDATKITADLLENKLHEAGKVEANVAIGYHAVEFLLWGQDLNGTGPGAGARPAADYDVKACAHAPCDRRADYLRAATDLLVKHLAEMVSAWGPNGAARKHALNRGDAAGLVTLFTGLGSLSYGELAGERMKLGLMLHDPEEEQDCFSDNTHNSHWYDVVGMNGLWTGVYTRRDGTQMTVPAPAALVAAKAPAAAAALDAALATTTAKMKAIKDAGDSGRKAYDQMLAEGDAEGAALIGETVTALVAQTRAIEAVVKGLGLKIKVEGSDSLDSPNKVKK